MTGHELAEFARNAPFEAEVLDRLTRMLGVEEAEIVLGEVRELSVQLWETVGDRQVPHFAVDMVARAVGDIACANSAAVKALHG